MKRINRALFILVIMSMMTSCTTQKRKDDPSKLGMFYHNTTSKYNGFFNADVLYTEAILSLNDQHQDNYNQILEIFPYVATDNPKSVAGSLDEAIKKVSVIVNLHRPSHWTDDCYLLLGKAQYIKQDYEAAEQTFAWMKENFSPEALKKLERKRAKSKKKKRRKSSGKKKVSKKKSPSSKNEVKAKDKKVKKKKKKRRKPGKPGSKKKKPSSSKSKTDKNKKEEKIKEEIQDQKKSADQTAKKETKSKNEEDLKPENYFAKHRPVYQDGLLWLARTYLERDRIEEAERIMTNLENDPKTHKDVQKELAPIQAYAHLMTKDYALAIPYLERAIKSENKRNTKARYAYIIAQIHQKIGNGSEAFAGFERALKFSTDYEMEFSSRLNIVQNAWLTGSATEEKATKDLEVMLKDIKNEDYKDQIYFTLAKIALKNDNKENAIGYLENSLAVSSGNVAQEVETNLQLAQLYYETEEYVEAKTYYDNTLSGMPKTDERYDEVKRFAGSLTDIALNLEIIELQDSLLMLAQLSDEERKDFATKLQQKKDQERLDKLKAEAEGTSSNPKNFTQKAGAEPSTWFAYDFKSVRKGKRDFERKWNDIQLEDNWRRSSHRGISNIAENEIEEVGSRDLTDEEIDAFFKDVPNSPLKIKESEELIKEAMLTLGRLYQDKIENYEKAIAVLEELLKRFPEASQELDAWYFTYLAYLDLNDSVKAQIYKDKIVAKYADTTIGRALSDPDFLANSKREANKVVIYYDETYDFFNKRDYKTAHSRVAKSTEMFGPKNPLRAKFALLNSLCIGNLEGKESYVKSLKDVIAKYPKSAEQKRAKEILRYLGEGIGNIPGIEDENESGEEDDSMFKIEDTKTHYFIIVLKHESIKLNDAKIAVSDYNKKYHNLDKIRISNIYLGSDTSTPILVLRRFKTKEKAMDYYDGIQKNKEDFLPESAEFELYSITQYNYRQILKVKSLENYKAFFDDNYLLE